MIDRGGPGCSHPDRSRPTRTEPHLDFAGAPGSEVKSIQIGARHVHRFPPRVLRRLRGAAPDALAYYERIKEPHTEANPIDASDAAVIEGDRKGKVKIVKNHETPTRAGGGQDLLRRHAGTEGGGKATQTGPKGARSGRCGGAECVMPPGPPMATLEP